MRSARRGVLAGLAALALPAPLGRALARAPQGSAVPVPSFDALPDIRVPPGTDLIRTAGYGSARPGSGGALYASDRLATPALARAHPGACRASADGRWFRLLPSPTGAITPEQLGCPAAGNAQPALQAAVAYANAVGIRRVELPEARYDLWAPIRRRGEHHAYGLSGHYVLVREDLAIVGTGRGRTLLRCLNSRGGTNDRVTQPGMTYAEPAPTGSTLAQQRDWLGSGINVRPNTAMDLFRLENVELDGTRTWDPAAPREPQVNLTHKGVRLQDVTCTRVELRGVTLRNWGGEIYYTSGGLGIREEVLENCLLAGSPQCALNSQTSARSTYTDVQAGDAYQNEIIGGYGKQFLRCRFHDVRSMALMGGAGAGETGFREGYPYSYPIRRAGAPPPWMEFADVTMERCGTVAITSFAKGNIRLVDSQIGLSAAAGRLSDIDLTIVAVVDRTTITEPLSLSGPDNRATRVGRTTAMVEPPSDVRVDLTCTRTAAARAAGRRWQQAVRLYPRLFDAGSVAVTVHGNAAARLLTVSGTPVPGFAMPRIMAAPDFAPVG